MTSGEEQPAVVRFSGAQTIGDAEEARRRLLAALEQGSDALSIDCRHAETCDLAFVQILLAARKSAADKGRPFSLMASSALARSCVTAGIDIAMLSNKTMG